MTTSDNERARSRHTAVEPEAAGVYFAPEAHAAYEQRGFDPSPAAPQADGQYKRQGLTMPELRP